jgi:membrane associated rhomboid family serine protease
MASMIDEIKARYQSGDALTQIILINLGVFVLYLLLRIISFLSQVDIAGFFIDFTALPSDLFKLATRPWTLVTYMFLHEGLLHILFNLLWLYFAGQLFLNYFGSRRLISTYLMGGLIGGAMYVLFYNLFPAFSEVVAVSNNRGASAGVMAIIVAIATYNPRYPVRLFFVLSVPLWGIAAFALLMDLIGLGDGVNAGGRLAHIGGAAFGFFMARAYKQGRDLTEGFSELLDKMANWFKPKSKLRTVHRSNGSKRPQTSGRANAAGNDEEKLNTILEKISRSGYDSLTKEEKDHLFKIGRD